MDEKRGLQISIFAKVLDSDVRTDPFGENKFGERAYRKAERLIAAIFLLTNHISEGEALKAKVRSTALSILEQILSMRDEMRTLHSSKSLDFQSQIRVLISEIKILVFAGLISASNAEAVCSALDDLGTLMVVSQRTHLSESLHFSREELLSVRENYKGQIRDIKDNKHIKDKRTQKDNHSPQDNEIPTATSVMSARATRIVEILGSGGEMNIRDIASHVPEYGEKTIQRELALLIERGLVRRIGLKRWSRYSLAS